MTSFYHAGYLLFGCWWCSFWCCITFCCCCFISL